MANIQPFKRLNIEDFDEKDRPIISKLAYSLNAFTDDVYTAFSKNITIADNLTLAYKTILVTVDATGKPTSNTTFATGLNSQLAGINIVKAVNQLTATSYPTSAPFMSYSENNGLITIKNICGLQANNKYSITMLLFT